MYFPKLMTVVVAASATFVVTGCSSAPKTTGERTALESRSRSALDEMKAKDANLANFLQNAYGYVIFPSVGKGGFIVGGGYGRGEVYEQGKFVGYADITTATVGAQIGGQTFSELIVFQNQQALENFRYGKVKFTANASAVALKANASVAANYSNGVAVFTMSQGGLMAEAAVGGQEFGYVPASDADRQMHSSSMNRDVQNASGSSRTDLAQPASSSDHTTTYEHRVTQSGSSLSPATRPTTQPKD